MTQADRVHTTPPTNTRITNRHPAGARMTSSRELHPRDVLADLLGSEDFPAEIADTEGVADLILQRLRDAGFVVVPDGPDVALFAAIENWRGLWRASEKLPDRDQRGNELALQAMDVEHDVAAMEPSTVAGYHAWVDTIRESQFDDRDLYEIVSRVGRAAGRLGIAGDLPDLRAPR